MYHIATPNIGFEYFMVIIQHASLNEQIPSQKCNHCNQFVTMIVRSVD